MSTWKEKTDKPNYRSRLEKITFQF